MTNLDSFTDILGEVDEICDSQPISLPSSSSLCEPQLAQVVQVHTKAMRPSRRTGQHGEFRSIEEIDPKYRSVFTYPFFNLVQSRVIDEALYSDKSMVVCAPTGSGKTVIFEMAIVQLLMELDDKNYTDDFKIIYMAPVKALCTERLTEWYPKLTRLGLMCIEVTGDTDVDFSQLKPYRVIITTPEKWDMLTRRWRDHRGLVEMIKLFLIDEVHILNDETRGPVLEAVVSRMKTIESSAQSAHRLEQLKQQFKEQDEPRTVNKESSGLRIRFVAVSATVSNPDDVAAWLGTTEKPAVFYKFGDECRPVKIKRVVEGYPCSEGTSIFKFDIILNYKLWPVIQKYHDGKPTLIFCNTRKSVALTAETLSRELTICFTPEQKAKLTAVASTIKNKKLQALVLSGVGCHHAGLLYEERLNIEQAFKNRDLPILITTTTLAMGVNLPAHLVIVKNTQQYVNGAYQEYSISTVLQMVGRAGRPQFDTEATAVIMTRLSDKARYQALVGGSEPLHSYLHKRLAENLNSEAALGTVTDVAQCVQWLRSTFLYVRAAREPKRYLGLPQAAPTHLILKKIEELCVKAMNGLATAGMITMDEASCIESTEAGRLMSIYYLDLETMKHIMKIEGTESLEKLLWIICESHELADMHLRVDERRVLNALNRNNAAATIRFPMKGKIMTRQMKVNCMIQAILGCLPIPDPSLHQEAMKIMRIADRVCKCLVAYVTQPDLASTQPQYFTAVLNSLILAKCLAAQLWENSPYVSKQLKGIGPTFSTLLATAGKTNFLLLEESHPRDLERIMNKGAPAGNILRKQVSLLPKYQLTMTPIDEKKVTMQLTLLNQTYLGQNMEQLTASNTHKCYVAVGDSENHLISLTSFKDKDLISVYDGTITHEITRKHRFEHKVFVHCISSNFVGIDTQCEYTFKDLDPIFTRGEAFIANPTEEISTKKTTKKQTTVTDSFKQRKRKNTDDITQSKEKKKRDNALLEKFRYLKESFAMASKEINEELHKSAQVSNQILQDMIPPDTPTTSNNINDCVIDRNASDDIDPMMKGNTDNLESAFSEMMSDDENYCVMVDDRIDSILNEIESKFSKNENPVDVPKLSIENPAFESQNETAKRFNRIQSSFFNKCRNTKVNRTECTKNIMHQYETRIQKGKRSKSNYNFIDLLEKNTNLSDDDETEKLILRKETGFSDTIKSEIEKFLMKTTNHCSTNHIDVNVKELLEKETEIDKTNEMKDKFDNTFEEKTNQEEEASKINKKHYNNDMDVTELEVGRTNNKLTENNIADYEQQHGIEIVDLVDERNENLSHSSINNTYTHYNTFTVENDPNILKTKIYNKTKKQNDTDSNIKEDINSIVNNINHSILETEMGNRHNKSDIEDEVIDEENNHVNEHIGNIDKCTENHSFNENALIPNNLNEINCKFNELYPETNKTKTNINYIVPLNNQNIEKETSINKRIDLLYEPLLPKMSLHENPYIIYGKMNIITKEQHENPCQDVNRNEISNDLLSVCDSRTKNINQQTFHNKYSLGLENTYPTSMSNMQYSNYNGSTTTKHHNIPHIPDEGKNTNINQMSNNNTSKQEGNINKYSYTATKIDVCIKNTAQRQLQIVRKMKLDLNVTEIISSKGKSNMNKSSNLDLPEIVCAYGDDNFNNSSEMSQPKQSSMIEHEIPESKIDDFEYYRCMEIENFKDVEDMEINKYNVAKTIKNDTKDKTTEKTIKKHEPEVVSHRQEVGITKPEIVCVPENPKTKVTESTCSAPNSEVGRILQKYSTILRKNNSVLTNSNTENSINKNLVMDVTKPSISKVKRPYKISDIHNLDVSLPKTLIVEASRSPKPTSDAILTRIRAMDQNNVIISNDINKIANSNMPQGSDIEENLNEDIPDCHSPVPELLEPSTDFKIDESMFNPKTLLQCFSTQDPDVIIPPPAEFCDSASIYSPIQSKENYDFHRHDNPSNYNEFDEPPYEGVIDTETFFEHDGSIFQENIQQNNILTPTKEIETWTLSQDDSYPHASYLHHSGLKSYTIMRNNSPIDRPALSASSHNHFYSRNAKLSQFKLKQKSKLRM